MSNNMKKGSISIAAHNIMPVIKRWLYSDKDIFIRELVSNGTDAITKLKMLGKGEGEDLRVTVVVDKERGELRFEDNGIGMTAEEVEKYINQVAFSSAEDFLKNYTGEDTSGIIGHFGLGSNPPSWPAIWSPLIRCPGRRVPRPCCGKAPTAWSLRWARARAPRAAPPSR